MNRDRAEQIFIGQECDSKESDWSEDEEGKLESGER
jgi:hypothetical protein